MAFSSLYGTTKIYTITATKEETTALGLSSLTIKDVEFKNFDPAVFEYKVDFKGLDKLEIQALANQEGATVEILGNENLVDGENVITIIVTSADGTETVTYQIKANRLITSIQEENKQINWKTVIISAVIALVILVVIIILIVKYVKQNDNSYIDYEYHDNLDKKEVDTKNDIEIAEEILPEKNADDKQEKKSKVDDLFTNYEEDTPRKRSKGKHSK